MEITTDGLRQSMLLASPNAGLSQINQPNNRPTLEAVKAINQSELFGHDRQLVLARDPKTKQHMIKIVDRLSGQTIGQIPSEVLLQMAAFWQPT
jgi:uncharacterized FlaG/YvyC family protein